MAAACAGRAVGFDDDVAEVFVALAAAVADTTMPSMNWAPRPAPRHRSPSAMHKPSPPSRAGAPTNAVTRSTIGKCCHAVILIGLMVPDGRSIGPADAMPTPRT